MITRLRELREEADRQNPTITNHLHRDSPTKNAETSTEQEAGGTGGLRNCSDAEQRPEQRAPGSQQAKQKLNHVSSGPEGEEAEQSTTGTSWSEMSSVVIGSEYSLSPLTPAMEQRLILQYLTPLGDIQEVSF